MLNDPSASPFRDCPNITVYPRRSFDTESASDCDDTIEQDHDVGFTDPPQVELSTPVHHLDEHSVTPVDDITPMSHCHQEADYPYDVPDDPRRSLRQLNKPKWLADYETV